MGTGLYAGGIELSEKEARAAGWHPAPDNMKGQRKRYRFPRYATGNLYTREGLTTLFSRDWPDHRVTADDVRSWTVNTEPVGHLPFPEWPDVSPSEETSGDDHVRMNVITKHEEQRRASRKSRELFDPAGLEVFVPDGRIPRDGDTTDEWNRKADRIHALRTDDV